MGIRVAAKRREALAKAAKPGVAQARTRLGLILRIREGDWMA
jgi:hypothetical protein